jgi:signal transduction histidine kinase
LRSAGSMDDFLSGGGECGALARGLDWSATPLGPPESWPQSLKTTVSLLLSSKYPMFIFWGPDLVKIYNDAYRPITGDKHPWAFGRPGPAVWPEIWADIRPLVERALAGEATWSDDLMLFMRRSGFSEEVYFTFSYSPIRDESGGVGGMFCACTETTRKVLGERRLRTLRDLAARPLEARSVADACAWSAEVLETNRLDVPFALVYLLDGERRGVRLAAAAGVSPGHAFCPDVVDGDADRSAWPLLRVMENRAGERLDDLAERFPDRPPGPWPDPPSSAMLLPIVDRAQDRPAGVIVLGISSRRVFDKDYRSWFELIAGQVASSIASARALEEERRRAQALAELDRAKTTFFSNVSHEFRTPLTLMLGPLERALDGTPGGDGRQQREELEVVRRNGLRLLKLVNTLLDFSRIEAGRAQASYEPTDLAVLTADLASVFRAAIENAGLGLIVDCPPLPDVIHVDREMWEKIVFNLLSNAFKFTFQGEITVTIRPRGDRVELAVRDTGIGIAPDEMPHLFERFHRVRGARSRSHEGTGIGLALVHDLVELHGGSVRVESVLDQGSTFTISIPVGTAHLPPDRIGGRRAQASTALGAAPYVEEVLRWLPDPDAPGGPPEFTVTAPLAAGATIGSGGRGRIVWADDNADMRDYVRRLLGAHYDVEAVADGRAALTAARARRPDLVLADVMMPELDGFGLLRALRADPGMRTLPVILLSARAGEESCVEGLEAGADAYLVKPFSGRELLAHVSAHIELGRMRARIEEERVKALREADRRKDEFLATLSHELRTPLNAMLGWVRLLRSGRMDAATTRQGLEVVERSVTHQARLITDLLDVSRIISGTLTLDAGLVDLGAVVDDVIETMRPTAETKALTLIAELPDNVVPVLGDAGRLRQVVDNLVSNAVKFTPSGGHVLVRLARADARVRLSVSDTGKGIRAEFLPHIFERFRQADSTSTRGQAGLGLGLAIARHIVDLHHGGIHAASDGEGKGTTFTVDLPAATEVEAQGLDGSGGHAGAGEALELLDGVHVLVVDDDAAALDLATVVLRQQGAQVTACQTVDEALATARRARPDAVVCDIAMPGQDGFALIRTVRSWPSDAGGAVPALALTAYARPEDREQALTEGFQMHLSKPVEPRDLIGAVARLAGRRRADPGGGSPPRSAMS